MSVVLVSVSETKPTEVDQTTFETLENGQAISRRLDEAVKDASAVRRDRQRWSHHSSGNTPSLNRGATNLAEDTDALNTSFSFEADYLKVCQRERACASREVWMWPACLRPGAMSKNSSQQGAPRDRPGSRADHGFAIEPSSGG